MIWSIFFFISLISTLLRKTLYLAMSSCKHIIPLKNKIGKSLAFNREVLSTCIFENNNIFEYILYTVFSMVCFFFSYGMLFLIVCFLCSLLIISPTLFYLSSFPIFFASSILIWSYALFLFFVLVLMVNCLKKYLSPPCLILINISVVLLQIQRP